MAKLQVVFIRNRFIRNLVLDTKSYETFRTTRKELRNCRAFCTIFHSFGNPFFLYGFNKFQLQYVLLQFLSPTKETIKKLLQLKYDQKQKLLLLGLEPGFLQKNVYLIALSFYTRDQTNTHIPKFLNVYFTIRSHIYDGNLFSTTAPISHNVGLAGTNLTGP